MESERHTKASRDIRYARVSSPVGELLVVGEQDARGLSVRGIYFADAPHAARALPRGAREDAAAFGNVRAQLDAYFAGTRTDFELSLAPEGTAFQKSVWQALRAIPYGTTTSYAAVAASVGRPRAVRAVGAANARNPISIVVPCHRVVGSDRSLTGYAGGLAAKRQLLALENGDVK